MKIELHQIKIRELCESYQDLSIQEEGITGYRGSSISARNISGSLSMMTRNAMP